MTDRPRLGAATIRPEPAPTVNRTQETAVTDQPAPIRKSDLPATPPAEWEFHTWFPHPDGGGDMVPGERQRGVLVRRRVSHGDWEPVRPDHWVDESPTDVAPAVVSAPVPPTDQTALRDRVAEALLEHLSRTADIRPGRDGQLAFMPEITDAERMRIAEHLAAELRRLAAEARGAQQDEAARPERPRCPHCGLPHDLDEASGIPAVCASIRASIADADRRHAEGDHGGCAAVACDVVRARRAEEAEAVVEPHCAGFPTTCPAPVTVPPAPPHHGGGIRCGCYDTDRIVGYRLGGQNLSCVGCTPSPRGDIWEPVTSEDLPDGGVCSKCGVDVLIPQEPQS